MSDIDIFAKGVQQTPSVTKGAWATFNNIGDKVQGTYVGNRQAKDSYGNDQTVYELLTPKGIMNVGIRNTKKILTERMDKIKFGQIVGFVFKETIPGKDPSGKPTKIKIIDIWADPKIVDNAWLESQGKSTEGVVETPVDDPIADLMAGRIKKLPEMEEEKSNFGVKETTPVTAQPSLISEITNLAKFKLGIIDTSVVKERVMEVTGIAFIPANYEKIIAALRAM